MTFNEIQQNTQRAKELYEDKKAYEAIALMRELILVEPANESHRIQLALYLRALGNFDESLFYVDKVSPSMSGYAMLKGWHLLRQGSFNEGMQMRESELGIYRSETLYGFPLEKRYIQGTPVTNKKILLVQEGGNGDEIAYLRFTHTLQAQGARVCVAISRAFVGIAERSNESIEVVCLEEVDHTAYDYYVPAMSFFSLFDCKDPSLSIPFPYVFPDSKMTSTWRPIISKEAAGRLKIGIQWQGNPEFDHVEFKTLPAHLLAQFASYGKLFLIQRPETVTDDNRFPSTIDAFDTQTEAPNWEQTLAVINEMDYVIAGDTTIIHMAGALGKKAFALLPLAPHPYWADLKETATWYPSVNVVRQPSYNAWDKAVQKAFTMLDDYTGVNADIPTLLTQGQTEYEAGDFEAALTTILKLYAVGVKDPQLQVFEAECLYHTGKAEEAAIIMGALHDGDPSNSNYAILLSQYKRALGAFTESFDLLQYVNPQTPGYFPFLGWHTLQQGKFLEGFKTLHKEVNLTDITQRYSLPPQKQLHKGIDINGKTIFLVLDGGFGDQVLSVRFAKYIEERGAHVITGVTEPLLSVFRRIPFVTDARVITGVADHEYDYYLSGILCLDIFEIEDPSVDVPFPYLYPDTQTVERMKVKIQSHNDKKKIGIHWQGNLEFDSREKKSIPAADMLSLEECGTLFSLQRDAGTNTLPVHNNVVNLQTGPASWEDTIALMSLMDAIVTNDSSIAHIAGALHKNTAVVVPLAPSLYWIPFQRKNMWYPHVAVFPQPTYNNWIGALSSVKNWIKEM